MVLCFQCHIDVRAVSSCFLVVNTHFGSKWVEIAARNPWISGILRDCLNIWSPQNPLHPAMAPRTTVSSRAATNSWWPTAWIACHGRIIGSPSAPPIHRCTSDSRWRWTRRAKVGLGMSRSGCWGLFFHMKSEGLICEDGDLTRRNVAGLKY